MPVVSQEMQSPSSVTTRHSSQQLATCFMVVNGLPESDPKVQDTQPANNAANKSAGNHSSEIRETQQQWIVCPFGRPRKNRQQNSKRRTQGYEQQGANAEQPDVQTSATPDLLRCGGCIRRASSGRISRRWFLGCRKNSPRICVHAALPQMRAHPNRIHPIWVFYGLRALIRSPTSR